MQSLMVCPWKKNYNIFEFTMGIQWDTAEILQSHTAETLANCLTPSQNGLNTLNK